MQINIEEIFNRNQEKYTQILRLLHLIEGVNKSIKNSQAMKSRLMIKQYEHLKKQYTEEFLKALEEYKLQIGILEAA